MKTNPPSSAKKAPVWVYGIIIALAAIEPLTHGWIASVDRPDAVPTGLHTADSAIYLHCMAMLHNDFYSPYATCKAPNGPNDAGFLPAPFHWLYALAGWLGGTFGADRFFFLGLINAFGGLLYLVVAYRFLREAAPRQANLAFLLFTLSGGLGGILYLLTGLAGLHGAARFDAYFLRFSMYELVEGPYLSPALHMPRLYYTLSLACCIGALEALLKAVRTERRLYYAASACLLFIGTLINLRFGGFTCFVALLYLLSSPKGSGPIPAYAYPAIVVPAGLALAIFAAMTASSPTYMENTGELVLESLWLTPFISAAFFHLFLVPMAIKQRVAAMPPFGRTLACAAIGYLACFALLFVGYQVYYGNFLTAGDSTAAILISDWALLGGLLGGLGGLRYGILRGTAPATAAAAAPETGEHVERWIAIWFLILLALAVSAFGQGAYARLTPQRLMVFLGLPMSILSAAALQHIATKRPRFTRAFVAAMVAFGTTSTLVGALYFQGPLQGPFPRDAGAGPFAARHAEIMTQTDAALLEEIGEGFVLAPLVFNDALAMRPGVRVLGGAGSTDLSDQLSVQLHPRINAFFSENATEDERRAFLDEWCIDYVYCPDTWPVSQPVVDAIRSMPGLEVAVEKSQALLLTVDRR